jgi:spore germination protein
VEDAPVEIDYTPPSPNTSLRLPVIIAVALTFVAVAAAALYWTTKDSDSKTVGLTPSTTTTEATIPLEKSDTSSYRSAWLTYWDDGTGLESFQANARQFDEFHPFWFEVRGATEIVTQGSTSFRQRALQTAKNAGVKVVPTLTESLKTKEFLQFMAPDDSRAEHVRTVCALANDNDFDGIDIDYEMFAIKVAPEDIAPAREAFSKFIRELAACLHADGRTLQVTLLPKTSDADYAPYLSSLAPGVFDYKAIGAAADIVRPMAYDNATPLTSSASTDPLPWVREVGEYARKYIPARKVVLGIALYGYDWGPNGAKSITARQAPALARQKNATVLHSDRVHSRFFEYRGSDGGMQSVWFNTSADTQERAQLATELGLAGVSYWALGNEDRDFWKLLPTKAEDR